MLLRADSELRNDETAIMRDFEAVSKRLFSRCGEHSMSCEKRAEKIDRWVEINEEVSLFTIHQSQSEMARPRGCQGLQTAH